MHTIMHHSSTSTYTPNFIEIEETFCGWTDGHFRPTLLGQLKNSRPNNLVTTCSEKFQQQLMICQYWKNN